MVRSVPYTATVQAAELPLKDLEKDFDRAIGYLKQTRKTITSIVVRDAVPVEDPNGKMISTLGKHECRLFMSPLSTERGRLYVEHHPHDFEWCHAVVKKLGAKVAGIENQNAGGLINGR